MAGIAKAVSRDVTLLSASAIVGAFGIAAVLWWLKKKAKGFQRVAYIKKIFIYPVKSLPGIEVPYAKCVYEGPVYETVKDRSLMVVRGDYYVSQREEPTLALIKLSYKDGKIRLEADGMPSLCFDTYDASAISKQRKTVRIKKHIFIAVDVSEEASAWLTKYLHKGDLHLVRILQDECNKSRHENSTSPIAFQDCSSFHVLSEASLEDLKSRIPLEPISVRNFRPNFFVEGCESYAEDNWSSVQLGGAIIGFFHRCPRCILTTVNPHNGVRSDKEPLSTLRSYRTDTSEYGRKKYKMGPLFGILCRLQKEGVAQVGDVVHAVVANKPLL